MAPKKKAAPKADAPAKDEAAKNQEADKALESAKMESPISTTGAMPVFRTDLGESLPPQKKPGVE